MDDKIIITKEDGSEVEMTILLTFKDDKSGYEYVLYYDENDEEGEVYPFRFKSDKHALEELQTNEEWEMVGEVLEAFLEEEE